jgi:hypothetical protein
MRRSKLVVAYGAPATLLIASLVVALADRHSSSGPLLFAAAALTAPLWAYVALRLDHDDSDRIALVTAFDFQMTMLVGYLLGTVLLLFFVGLLVFFVVFIAQCSFSGSAAWRAWRGEVVPEPRLLIRFSDRFRIA